MIVYCLWSKFGVIMRDVVLQRYLSQLRLLMIWYMTIYVASFFLTNTKEPHNIYRVIMRHLSSVINAKMKIVQLNYSHHYIHRFKVCGKRIWTIWTKKKN
jgi:hypothetical protein